MSSESNGSLGAKVWNYAHVLRNAGVSYGDYLEQITCLLFLKMDEERTENRGHASIIPDEFNWDKLRSLKGEPLATLYGKALAELRRRDGLLGAIFQKARNTIEAPEGCSASSSSSTRRSGTGLRLDGKGAIYEELLERNAQEVKSGAGQYFTPRTLIEAIIWWWRAYPQRVLDAFDFHTMLRLPTGIFYKQGVKANVLFFDKKPASETPWTKQLWIYDLRTNQRFTLKERPLRDHDLADFIALAKLSERHARQATDRFRPFDYAELAKRDKLNLDIFWLKDASQEDPDSLPPPDEIAAEIAESLEAALARFRSVQVRLAGSWAYVRPETNGQAPARARPRRSVSL
jgi:type I restriction-modification system DNA methylase subunit